MKKRLLNKSDLMIYDTETIKEIVRIQRIKKTKDIFTQIETEMSLIFLLM